LIVTHDSAENSSTVHEGAHFLDFYSGLREGADKIIGEIIAFRQQGSVYYNESGKTREIKWHDRLSDHIVVDYLLLYGLDTLEAQKEEQNIDQAIDIIKRLDENWQDSAAVTHILLNFLKLSDIQQWENVSDDDLQVMAKNKYD